MALRSEHCAQHIWPRLIVARAEAEADFFGDQIFHRAKAFDKFRQQRRAGGRDEFVRLVALRDGNFSRAENRQRGRRGNGKSSVRAINPAGAFDHRRGEHARLAEQFQRDGRADNVHDGIHRADFVKVDFVRRQAVNFSLRLGDALKDGDGFLLHPRRKFAARNQFFDFGKIPLVIMLMLVMMHDRVRVRENGCRTRCVVVMMLVVMCMVVVVVVREMDIKLHAGDGGFLPARNVQMPAVELEFLQLALQFSARPRRGRAARR